MKQALRQSCRKEETHAGRHIGRQRRKSKTHGQADKDTKVRCSGRMRTAQKQSTYQIRQAGRQNGQVSIRTKGTNEGSEVNT